MALFTLKGLNRRRWELFKANRRGLWSLWIFGALFLMSVFAPIIANDRPMLVSYKSELLFPTFVNSESKFGGFLARTDIVNQDEINANGWMTAAHPLFLQHVNNSRGPRLHACLKSHAGGGRANAARCCGSQLQFRQFELAGNRDQGRIGGASDLRLPDFRPSTDPHILPSIIGGGGAVQNTRRLTLLFQRFIDIWSSMPTLYLLIILAAFITPFWLLLFILVLS
jgi:microcin C transport system permease protein